MKISGVISFVFALLLSVTVFAGTPADESAVKQTISNYLSGIDSRNSDVVKEALDPQAAVLSFNLILNKTSRFTAGEVVSKVKNGGLGGWKRDVNFSSIDFNEKTAMAKVEIIDPKVRQTSFVTLINDNGEWKIVSDVSTVTQNKVSVNK